MQTIKQIPMSAQALQMGIYPNGTLLKSIGPEIDMIQGIERRWIPDPQTFNYMGLDWGAVQTVQPVIWATIPVGPPFPSRSDGTLLKGSDAPVYVMQNGQRRWIPDPATFNNLGYSWNAVQTVADSDLDAIPLGPPIAQGATVHPAFPIQASQDDHFPGSGGYMHTDVTLYSSGQLEAVTHTWEVTDLRGFRGAVAVSLFDQTYKCLYVTPTQHFGVDGRWIGTSDRTDSWSDSVPTEVLPYVRSMAIVQHWDPNIIEDIEAWIKGLTDVFNQLGPIIQAVKLIMSL